MPFPRTKIGAVLASLLIAACGSLNHHDKSDDQAVADALRELQDRSAQGLFKTVDLQAIKSDIDLPNSIGGDGVSINWSADSDAISPAGKVKQPSYDKPSAAVSLTATLLKNSAHAATTFKLQVAPAAETDAQAVAAAKANLTASSLTRGATQLDAVTDSLELSATGKDNTSIAWSSSDEAVLTKNGQPLRPAEGENARQATLTATISRGACQDTVTFNITVLPIPSAAATLADTLKSIANFEYEVLPDQGRKKLKVGDKVSLASLGEDDARLIRVSWSSSSPLLTLKAVPMYYEGTVVAPAVDGATTIKVTAKVDVLKADGTGGPLATGSVDIEFTVAN